ncbi:MAG: hypothetical protein K6E76_00600 [Patescibacteria group bacterium]|nr:hypothetical protein [Patescibacteria group bacterium]
MALIFCISFGYYDLDEDITNTGVSLQREFSSFGQGIEKIVFMISGDRDDPNNITMQLQGNTIVVDKAFTAGSPTNKME